MIITPAGAAFNAESFRKIALLLELEHNRAARRPGNMEVPAQGVFLRTTGATPRHATPGDERKPRSGRRLFLVALRGERLFRSRRIFSKRARRNSKHQQGNARQGTEEATDC